jgi:SPP1 gp7 family putative phage head morphogenesis protein
VDRYTTIRRGIWAAEEIAKSLGVSIFKALDPLDPADFVTISLRLSRALRGAVAGAEGEALKAAIEGLDVDWPNITEARRDRVIAAARAEVADLGTVIPDIVDPVLESSGLNIIKSTREAAVDRFSLDIEPAARPVDTEVSDLLRASTSLFVTDQYGLRGDALDQSARDIVAGGLEQGLGREDISAALASKLGAQQVAQSKNYWNILSTHFSNTARTTTQLGAFDQAGIDKWRYDAVLDAATSDFCRLLHGRVFSVSKALTRSRETLNLTDPDEIKNARPWVQTGTNADGDQILYYERAGQRHQVAEVEASGIGRNDVIGTYKNSLSSKAMEAAGVVVPPTHGHCRSTLVTVE